MRSSAALGRPSTGHRRSNQPRSARLQVRRRPSRRPLGPLSARRRLVTGPRRPAQGPRNPAPRPPLSSRRGRKRADPLPRLRLPRFQNWKWRKLVADPRDIGKGTNFATGTRHPASPTNSRYRCGGRSRNGTTKRRCMRTTRNGPTATTGGCSPVLRKLDRRGPRRRCVATRAPK